MNFDNSTNVVSYCPTELALTSGFRTEVIELDKASIVFRPFQPGDRRTVFQLLSILPSLYPNGSSWLKRRLDDVLAGKARCTVAVSQWGIVGTTIETPKGLHRIKLSTIFVHPYFRGLNIGTRLLDRCRADWLRGDIDRVYVTSDLRRVGVLLPVLTRFGFRTEAIELGRYGSERDEIILSWNGNKL